MATTDQIDLVGDEVPLRFKVGESIEIPVQINNADGSAANITGRTYTGDIGSIGEVIASFTTNDIDLPNGQFSFIMNNFITIDLAKGRYNYEFWEDNHFLWGGPVEIEEQKVTA